MPPSGSNGSPLSDGHEKIASRCEITAALPLATASPASVPTAVVGLQQPLLPAVRLPALCLKSYWSCKAACSRNGSSSTNPFRLCSRGEPLLAGYWHHP